MNLRKVELRTGAVTAVIVMASMLMVVVATIPHAQGQVDRSVHDEVVEGYQDQIALLKWIGGAVIITLSTAVTTLFAMLVKQWRVIVGEVRRAGETREATNRLAAAIERLEKKIEFCPARTPVREKATED